MPSLAIPSTGLVLGGPSDHASSKGARRPDVVGLSLSDSVIEGMIKCVRDGSKIQLQLGDVPIIQYGSKIQHFARTSSASSPTTEELYHTSQSTSSSTESDNTMAYYNKNSSKPPTIEKEVKVTPSPAQQARNRANFAGIFGLKMKPVPKPAAPPVPKDDAVLALQRSMAAEEERKKGNTITHVKDGVGLPPPVQKRGPALPLKGKRQGNVLSNKHGDGNRSLTASPALIGLRSPAPSVTSAAPLSQQQAEKAKEIRRPIIHELAVQPQTEDYLFAKVECSRPEFQTALEKVADKEPSGGKWSLRNKSYRELDVFAYNYASDERQIAINNAIKVYDKLRLAASEPEWERLLPKSERGQGKCLSKLQAKIAESAVARVLSTKAEDSGKDTAAEDEGDKSTLKNTAGQKKMSDQQKRLLGKGPKAKAPPAKAKKVVEKEKEKESGRIKSSKFVEDSDEEEPSNTQVDRKTGNNVKRDVKKDVKKKEAPSRLPPSTTKRAREDDTSDSSVPLKKARNEPKPVPATNTSAKKPRSSDSSFASRNTISFNSTKPRAHSPQKSSPLATSPPTNASDFADTTPGSSTSPYAHQRKVESTLENDRLKRQQHQKSASSSSLSSLTSVESSQRTPSAETMAQVAKFEHYHAKYHALHLELAAQPRESMSRRKLQDLLDMRERLATMKQEIAAMMYDQ